MWSPLLICFFLVLSTNAFSKYGRTCKDIGCLNSEVCVLAEDPCSFGRSSDCGSYPTCKKKSAVESGGETYNVPVTKPTTPKPIAEIRPAQPPSRYDDTPNYPPPPPPRAPPSSSGGSGLGGLFGNNQGGGSGLGSLFGNNGGGFGSLFGNSNNPSSGGSSNPFSNFGFGSNNPGSGGSGSSGSSGSSGNPFGTIFSNLLNNFTKGGLLPALNPSFTRPIVENKNRNPDPYNNPYGNQPNPYGNQPNPYGNQPNPYGYQPNPYGNQPNPYGNPYQRPASNYPSYSQPNSQGQPLQQNGYVAKNYGQSHSVRNAATTTRKPVAYGWNMGVFCVLALSQYILRSHQ